MLVRFATSLLRVSLFCPSSSRVRPSNLACKFRDFTMSSVDEPPANSDVILCMKSTDSAPIESQIVAEATADLTSEASPAPVLSKSARKRIAKQQKWQEGLEHRRQVRKEKRKARRQRSPCDEKRVNRPLRKDEVIHTGVSIVFDMSYDDEMSDLKLRKVRKQLQHSYGFNRRHTHQAALYFTSYHGRIKEDLQRGAPGVDNWDCTLTEKSYDEVFDKDQIVYLSAESPNTLTSLDKGKAYIIGALVDHNSRKGISYGRALEKGFSHAKLPITEHIKMNGRLVLSITHVMEILVRYMNTQDWTSALLESIPGRKQPILLAGSDAATAGASAVAAESTDAAVATAASTAEQETELASTSGDDDSDLDVGEDRDAATVDAGS